MRFHEFPFERRRDCAVCGDRPTITAPRDSEEPRSAAALDGVRRLTATGLRMLLDQHPHTHTLVLVDVREPREFVTGHLEGAINIPVAVLQQRLAEIAPQASPVFICRSGSRSLAACAIALRAGIAAPAHLEGGLLAWASEVDPTLAVAG